MKELTEDEKASEGTREGRVGGPADGEIHAGVQFGVQIVLWWREFIIGGLSFL